MLYVNFDCIEHVISKNYKLKNIIWLKEDRLQRNLNQNLISE